MCIFKLSFLVSFQYFPKLLKFLTSFACLIKCVSNSLALAPWQVQGQKNSVSILSVHTHFRQQEEKRQSNVMGHTNRRTAETPQLQLRLAAASLPFVPISRVFSEM